MMEAAWYCHKNRRIDQLNLTWNAAQPCTFSHLTFHENAKKQTLEKDTLFKTWK